MLNLTIAMRHASLLMLLIALFIVHPEKLTTPSAVAWISVPGGREMSTPV